MPELTFEEFNKKIQQHFAEENYTEGLSLASKHLPDFPESFALINYWRICMAARLGEPALANKILESTLASGLWYAGVLLRQSPALESMQGEPEFERLADISQKLQAADGMQTPMLVTRPENACGPEDPGCPTLVFLHDDMDSAQNSLKHLGLLSSHGWVVAAPQSSQSMYTGAYMWVDAATTQNEVAGHLEKLSQRYHLNPKQQVFSGLGKGAELALEIALSGELPAIGFILLSPSGPKMENPTEWLALIDKAAGRTLSGVVVVGQEDSNTPHENTRSLVKMLNEHKISTKLVALDGLAENFSPDIEQEFRQALDYLAGAAES